MTAGLIVAAPRSGSGKTLVTLALLRALARRGRAVVPAKCGPDYIDPAFLSLAAGRPALSLDPWAQRPETLGALAAAAEAPLVVEGVMGLYDGGPLGAGSTAELARRTGWPLLLVLDVSGQAQTAAAVALGLARHDPALSFAGVIFNRVGGEGHRRRLAEAAERLQAEGLPLLGSLPRQPGLELPSRHLGLVQAGELAGLEASLEAAADWLEGALDVEALLALTGAGIGGAGPGDWRLPPPGQRIAVARDIAFAFSYDWMLEAWRRAGAELRLFSPLADEAPWDAADAVFLPGGYPELHAGRLAAALSFKQGLSTLAAAGAFVYGECGGFMTLGEGLLDAEGQRHAMAGLLPLVTSFARPRLHLGYRRLGLLAAGPLGGAGQRWRGHEFHYAETLEAGAAEPLFAAEDAEGRSLGRLGLRRGGVCGSFLHLIDREGA